MLLALAVTGILIFPTTKISAGINQDGGGVCLGCHPETKKQIFSQNAHKPAEEGKCIKCHNPHTSNNENLLTDTGTSLCFQCHQKEREDFAKKYTHFPVEKGECLKCHQPHSSDNQNLLTSGSDKLCFSCHPEEKIFSRKNIHSPLKTGNCLKCHNPHASDHEYILTKDRKNICLDCHNIKDRVLVKKHNNYPLKDVDCLDCHNPHSSNRDNLAREFSHEPFSSGSCNDCHISSKKMKEDGRDLCLSCHEEVYNDFKKTFSHIQSNKDNTCLECHSPHASDHKSLKRATDRKICFSCHTETAKRLNGTDPLYKFKHTDIDECTSCHVAHGSNYRLLLPADENSSCELCHETQGKFTHPIGEQFPDPRSKRGMTCVSCHNPMGSKNKLNLRFDQKKELCIQCHKYKT